MKPVRFDSMEGVAALDQGALYRPLPMQRVTLEDGSPAVVSHWQPTQEEILALINGHTIKLTVLSNVINPVKVEVHEAHKSV